MSDNAPPLTDAEALIVLQSVREKINDESGFRWCQDCGWAHMPPVPCGYKAQLWPPCECEASGAKKCGQCEG